MSDVYVVIHLATTCDDSSSNASYVNKDSTELIEFAWCLVDARSLEVSHENSVLVKPVNTPITLYCSQINRISWEHVRDASSFRDAINQFGKFMQEEVISKNKEFSLVTINATTLRVQLPREARDKAVVLPPYLQHPRVFDLTNEYSKWQLTHPEALSYTATSLSNIITALQVELDNLDDLPVIELLTSNSPPPIIPLASSSGSISSGSGSNQDSRSNSSTNFTNDINSNIESLSNLEPRSKSTVSLSAKVLIQLIKKSLPIDEHQSVLTKPYDSAQDARIFLAERSKILYLSNLPSDTTQSELESWFTQYGGRPIAFWTLKNLEVSNNNNNNGNVNNTNNNNPGGNKFLSKKSKGISGFAVFSKHEEAAESLSMNGRVLNDRAIEVQASSTRVLDKANDLLTPFPPLKNRPRPGDWTCPSCGFSNFQRRTACFRCSFPATSAVTIQETMYSNNSGSKSLNSNNTSTNNSTNNNNRHHKNLSMNYHLNNSNNNGNPIDKFSLNAAVVNAAAAVLNNNQLNGNYNDHQFNQFDSQSSDQSHHQNLNGHGHGHSHSQSTSQLHNHGHGLHHNNHGYHHNHSQSHGGNGPNMMNGNHSGGSRYGNNVPFRAGDWKCSNENCQYHNFAKNLCCLKCGGAKPIVNNNNNNNNNNNSNNMSGNADSNHVAAAAASAHIHSVNSTAAAIAAATASGQPLNLSNSFIGLQQPQPQHAKSHNNHYSQPSISPTSNQYNNTQNKVTYSNNRQSGQFHHNSQAQSYYGHQSNPSQNPSQAHLNLLPQQLALLQQQQQQQQQQQGGFNQSVPNSPGLYAKFGMQQQLGESYPSQRNSISGPSFGAMNNNIPTNPQLNNTYSHIPPNTASTDPNTSSSFNALSSQIRSLTLNNQ